MEKTLNISKLSAIFTKDFDSFGKMDPFLQFKYGNEIKKTQIGENLGLKPHWTTQISFVLSDTNEIQVKAYDSDFTENQYMGIGKIDIKSLKQSGDNELTMIDKDNNSIGTITFKYQVKESSHQKKQQVKQNSLKQVPQNKNSHTDISKDNQKKEQNKTENITLDKAQNKITSYLNSNEKITENIIKGKGDKRISFTQISGKFTKDFDTFGKMDVFLEFALGPLVLKTQEATSMGKQPRWKTGIQFQYTDQNEIEIKAYDSDVTQNQYMGVGKIDLKSMQNSGNLQVTLNGQNKESIGVVNFKYEIINLKNQASSSKNIVLKQSQKKATTNLSPQKSLRQPNQTKNPEKPINLITHQQNKSSSKPTQRKQESHHHNISNVTFESKNNNDINMSKNDDINQSFNQGSINRSQNTFKLPNIGDISRNFGDRIFDKQSSATLQKSILVYSMPKAPRFGSGPKYSGEPSYYVDTCFKPNTTKGVGFGFGSKKQFPQWMERNMKQNPAPGSYFQESGRRTQFRQRGPTFGISHKFYEKVTIPRQKSQQKNLVQKSYQRLKPIMRNQ